MRTERNYASAYGDAGRNKCTSSHPISEARTPVLEANEYRAAARIIIHDVEIMIN